MAKPHFAPVDTKVKFPELEEKILKFWKENKIFEKSIENRPESKKWNFLDGPPFVTGLPHYGSLLSSLPKDLYSRYYTMKGYRVRRVWGWDGHGLPIENKVENKLGITRKKDIENKVGVKKFINECKKYVSTVSGEWEWYIDHVARWVDFKNAYKTWDRDYMESVMWVFKQMYDKNYIYKGLRVSLYCPHCSTPISNFEVAMDPENYKDITEPANVYKYRLKDEKDTFFLAWSTTPWNKLATPALAVNPKLTYVKVSQGKEKYILAKSTLGILNGKYKILDEFKGKDLVHMKFIPHFDFYKIDKDKRAFVIIPGDFVTADEGTGIVTIAAYGEDDLKVMEKENIQIVLHVDEEGVINDDVPKWGGMYYLKANKFINKDLEERGLMYSEKNITHSVAHCWRCHTRLLHAPQNAWYVDVQKLKPAMRKTNEKINWYPSHLKKGRFAKSMDAAPDWCISRSRYWGSPVPVWECECGDRFVPGSIAELEKKSGVKINDLHKPEIDGVTVKCDKCGKDARRVPEVLDSWIEAGSASFAERHFPFGDEKDIKDFFPPDFISEYTGQIRAWFYVLNVISTALYDSHAFKNVVVTGVIQGTDGRKMSKNFGNYPDPKEMISTYGGDALRTYFLGSPIMKGEDILISEEHYRDQVRGFQLMIWNIYNFFVSRANANDWKPKADIPESKNILDKWIMSLYGDLENSVTKSLDYYDSVKVIMSLKDFVNDLSKWYVRRSRDRDDYFDTLYFILTNFVKLLAPINPFLAESIYQNLTSEESVHLVDWPDNKIKADGDLLKEMTQVREAVENAHAERKEKEIPVRQPLSSLTTTWPHEKLPRKEMHQLVKDELNVKKWIVKKGKKLSSTFDTKITPELEEEAKTRELIRKIQNERKKLGVQISDKVNVTNDWLPKDQDNFKHIQSKAGTASLEDGDFKVWKV